MASVNKVILVGNLGRAPEMRYAGNGSAIATLNLATTDKYKDRNGTFQEQTEWHRVVIFGKQAEVAQTYLGKGSPVFIEGRLQTRKWQDKAGLERYTTEIVCDRMQLLGSTKVEDGIKVQGVETKSMQNDEIPDDWDIPFDKPGVPFNSAGVDRYPF